MIAQVIHGSWPICEIPQCLPTGHSTCRAYGNSTAEHIFSELWNDTDIDVLHTLRVRPISTQFWQLPLCNVSQLWQPDELH
jgi:hypothetical protein